MKLVSKSADLINDIIKVQKVAKKASVKEDETYKVSRPDGVTYEYNKDGKITKMVNENGETYQWKRDKNTMTVTETATDGDGKQYVKNTYDENGRVLTQDDGMEYTPLMKFAYEEDKDTHRQTTKITNRNGDTKEVTSLYGLILKSIDEKGNKTLYTYDENQHMASEVRNSTHAQTFTYNQDGCILSSTDEEGNITQYTYDSNNNVTSIIGSDGSRVNYIYNDKNLMTAMDRKGEHITYEYNKKGQLIKEISNNQRIKRYEYNDMGWLTKTIDGNGNETKYHYNNRGFIDKVVNPDNTYTEKTYDVYWSSFFVTLCSINI